MINDTAASKVRSLASKPEYASVIEVLSQRKNNVSELTLDAVAKELKNETTPSYAVNKTLWSFFRELAAAGVGEAIVGRRGKPSRFVWSELMMDVLAALRGEGAASAPDRPSGEGATVTTPSELVEHRFVLRPSFTARFSLPADFTAAEAARLAKFIEALPFDAAGSKE